MRKRDFMDKINKAIKNHRGITVAIELPKLPTHELITNRADNVLFKRDYYDQAYDDAMQLKADRQVKIVGISMGGEYRWEPMDNDN